MGEYATYRGESIKIGTCESMYYLRADQAHLVTAERGSIDPIRDAEHIRFRFPFPDEDNVEPGDFEDYSRGLALHGLKVPDGVQHYSVQFKADAGYLVSLPCPESASEATYTVHRNGFSGAVKISQQRPLDGRLVLVCECGGCGAMYRLPELSDAAEVLNALRAMAQQATYDFNSTRAHYYVTVAQRVSEGYTSPPGWLRSPVNSGKDGGLSE